MKTTQFSNSPECHNPDLLIVNNLRVSFSSAPEFPCAVRDVNLTLKKGGVLALVGESGSGKSMTALAIMRLLPAPGAIRSGTVFFNGKNLTHLSDDEMRAIRGKSISMVFQEPMTSLNPVLRIADQIMEPLILHNSLSRHEAFERGVELLAEVGIPSPRERMNDYPHQLSGGMRQRVMIAMALACNPALLIADEPTTALDVTIQAQILALLDRMRESSGLALLLITHDFGIVAERSEHTLVMYAGQIVESAPTVELLSFPRHPYTTALLGSLPQHAVPGKPLSAISGQLTQQALQSVGCTFAERCPIVEPICFVEAQPLRESNASHSVRCWKCA